MLDRDLAELYGAKAMSASRIPVVLRPARESRDSKTVYPLRWNEKISTKGAPQMAALDWSQCPAVESVPGRLGGAWVFKDTRLPVSTVFDNLEDGVSIEEIMEWFRLSREQIVTVLEFAARSLDAPVPVGAAPDGTNAHPL